jgi:signal transduction histidine kinase
VFQAVRDSAYLVATFPLGLAGFIVAFAGLATGGIMAVFWVGLPILAVTFLFARGLAAAQVGLLRIRGTHQGVLPWTRGNYLPLRWRRIVNILSNADRLREAAYCFIMGPVTMVSFTATLLWWGHGVLAPTRFLRGVFRIPEDHVNLLGDAVASSAYVRGAEILGLRLGSVPAWGWDLLIGLIALITLPLAMGGLALAQTALTRLFVTPAPGLVERGVAQLAESRKRAFRAEGQSLRRVERDLHDGPQQMLLRIGMDLSSAERRLNEGDPAAAAALVHQARTQNSAVLAELRLLVRGLAPPVLADRGLVPAFTAVAASSAIPATFATDVAEGERYPDSVERAAYFTVSEAVANATKYSGAEHVAIRLNRQGEVLTAAVHDDGRGGAGIVPGHGLAGLEDRAAGVDGHLKVASTPGRGTVIQIAIPCPGPPASDTGEVSSGH